MASPSVFDLGTCITQRLDTQLVCMLFSQGSMCPKVPCDWQKARAVKLRTSLYLCRGGGREALKETILDLVLLS